MVRKYTADDADLNTASIITSRTRPYSDLNLLFRAKPGTGDVYTSNDAEAVKQAVRNLILTNFHERPFKPHLGGNISRFVFELNDPHSQIEIRDAIATCISNYEPRATVLDITTSERGHHLKIGVRFRVVNIEEPLEITVSIERLR